MIAAILTQWRAIYAFVAIALVAGVFALLQLPEQVFPALAFSRVLVVAENADLAPTLVQAAITKPLEDRLTSVPGVQQVVANSTAGAAAVSITFDARLADPNVALARVSTAVGDAQAGLPKGTVVSIQQVDPSVFPILGYGLTSAGLDAMALREIAEHDVRPQIAGLPGVGAVRVLAGAVREYLISVDPQTLAAHSVTVDELSAAIAQTNTIASVGHTDDHYVRSTLLASGQAHSAADLARIPVVVRGGVPLTVGDLAAVVEAPAPPQWAGSIGGRSGVIVMVFAQAGASFPRVAGVVEGAVERFRAQRADVELTRFWNQAQLVTESIRSLVEAIVIGLVLSTLVLYAFLRHWSSTLVAALVIPLTTIVTFAPMRLLDAGLNLMTLGGLAVGVGLVIDDAIVVVENVHRHVLRGESGASAITRAVNEIAAPMISSTITTIVVFAPLGLLSGVTGAFFRALASTLTISLLLSLLFALIVTPNVALQTLHASAERPNPLVAWFDRRYAPLLAWALRRPAVILGLAVLVFALTLAVGSQLHSDFLPTLDEGAFELTFSLPPGTSLAETTRVAGQIETVVRNDPAIASEATVVGLTMQITDITGGLNTGKLQARLIPRARRDGIDTVMDRIALRVGAIAPGVEVSSRQLLADTLNDLSNAPAPIELRVFGSQQTVLVTLATEIAAKIARVRGVEGVSSGAIFHNPSIVIRALPDAARFGVSAADLARSEAVAFGGDVISSVIANPRTIPVRVRYAAPLDPTLAEVAQTPIVGPSGAVEPLGRLALIERGPPQSEINEMNGRRYLAVTSQVNGESLGSVIAGIKHQLATVALPPGYTVEIAGQYALQQQSFAQFAVALGLSMALVFVVMLLQFRSFAQPIAILATIPLAVFGAAVTLYFTSTTLNVSSLMGVILLVGLVVKNGILLLEYAHRRERDGYDVASALQYSATVRLRPILMTTLTALLGMLPLAFALGSGSELLQPLAIAVLGGLALSTLFTLIVIPVLYATLVAARRGRRPPTRPPAATLPGESASEIAHA